MPYNRNITSLVFLVVLVSQSFAQTNTPRTGRQTSRSVQSENSKGRQEPKAAGLDSVVRTTLENFNGGTGDYIPCEFTEAELLVLRPRTEAARLTTEESEQLREKVMVQIPSLRESGVLTSKAEKDFLDWTGQESFEDLLPSEALSRVMVLLNLAVDNSLEEQFSGTLVSYANATQMVKDKNFQGAIDQIPTDAAGTQARRQVSELLEKTINAKDAVVSSARQTIAKRERPPDVGCAMSIFSWNETRFAFGRLIANEYIPVQVVVRNVNDKQEFLLHDAEFAVDAALDGRKGRYYSGRDKLVVRNLVLEQQDFSPRNLVVHTAEAVGSLMSAVTITAGETFKVASGVFNSGFVPGFKRVWGTHDVEQLNLLNDIGFSSSNNYKTVVPKSGSVMFVIFVPSRQFEGGWWTQDCVDYIRLPSEKPRLRPITSPLDHLRKDPPTGIDVNSAMENCKNADRKQVAFLRARRVPYKNWSPTAISIFRELALTVVAGTHISEEVSARPVLGELACPTDAVGDVDFSKASGASLSCTITGDNLDKVEKLRLRNAQDATDLTTAEGVVTVSGEKTSGTVAFPLDQLGALEKPAYKVFTVTKQGAEEGGKQVLHFNDQPFVRNADDTLKVEAAPVELHLKGYHLDKAGSIILSGDSAASPVELALTKRAPTEASGSLDPKLLAKETSAEPKSFALKVKIDDKGGAVIDMHKSVSVTHTVAAASSKSKKPAPSSKKASDPGKKKK